MLVFDKRRGRLLLRFFGSVAGVMTLAILTIVLARAAWGMYGKFVEASRASEAAGQELEALRQKRERMTASVEALSTTRGVEAEVRARFGVVRDGEGEIKIIRDAAGGEALPPKADGLWSRLFKAFSVW